MSVIETSRINDVCLELGIELESLSRFETPKPPKHSGLSRREYTTARGEYAESKVATIIEALPFVDKVSRSQRFSLEDSRGIDLTVGLRANIGNLRVESVMVQVKSSARRIQRFKYRYGYWKDGDHPSLRDEQVALDRMIVINGQRSEGQIVRSFLLQLWRINNLVSEPN